MRPVKGQTVRLRDPGTTRGLLVGRVLRWEGGYLVPRVDGGYVLGATVEERGFGTSMTAVGVHELLRDAAEVVPGVLELEVDELVAGLRPGRPTTRRVLGASTALDGLFWATGHHRNGILLAPVTADLVAAELAGEAPRARLRPRRFAAPRPDRAAGVITSTGPRRPTATARRSPSCWRRSASTAAPAASPWPSTGRSSRAAPGRIAAWPTATASRR